MSGPKASSYDVVANAQREQRRLEAAQERARQALEWVEGAEREEAEAQLAFADHVFASPAVRPAAPASGARAEEWNHYADSLSEHATRVRARSAAATAEARTEAMLTTLQSATRVEMLTASDALSELGDPEEADRAELVEWVRTTLGRLNPGVSEQDRATAESLAAELGGVPRGYEQDARRIALRSHVDAANERHRRRRADAAEAEQLLVEMQGLAGEDVEVVRARLTRVVDGEKSMTEALRNRAGKVTAQAAAEADRAYAESVVLAALTDLGYEIAEEFSTLEARDGELYVRRPEWDDHAVRMRSNAEQGRFHFNVVRDAASGHDSGEDVAIETEWCQAHELARSRADEAGVSMTMQKQVDPGKVEVERVRVPRPRKERRRRKRPQPQARRLQQ